LAEILSATQETLRSFFNQKYTALNVPLAFIRYNVVKTTTKKQVMTVQPQLSPKELTHFNKLAAQENQHVGSGDQDRFLNICAEAVDYLTDLFQKSKVN
jgi:hypothetical protein